MFGRREPPVFCYFQRRCCSISIQEHQINEEIRDKEVRLVDSDGSQLGVVTIDKAMEVALDRGLDLVKIAPKAEPPVCRVMDYGKFRFEQAKKEKEARKNQKIVDIKEVRLSSKIDVHDYEVRVKAAKKFLEDGDKVKAAIRFRGREMAHTEIGLTVMQRFAESVAEFGTVEKPAKLEGRQMLMFIAPLKTK
jgi:translation initiation factor IF-3